MKNPAPYRYDIVGSFLRTKAIHEARSRFEAGEISAEELARVEDAEITGLVKKEENVGLHAVTDGEYRRSFWHMDFLWGLTGTQKVKSEHFSVAFKGFQPKAETVKIVDRLDFPDGSFDAVISNYVYHNVMGADKRALLLETLRVLKKGGVFVLHDNMKPQMYGDMNAFVEELRGMGFAEVQYVETAEKIFGSKQRAAMMMLGDSAMIVGRK